MNPYNKSYDESNAQPECVFEGEQDQRPTRRAVYQLAKRARISPFHAHAVLLANGPRDE